MLSHPDRDGSEPSYSDQGRNYYQEMLYQEKKIVKKMHLIDVYQALIDETILNDNDNNMNHYIFIRVDTHISGFFQYPVFGRIVFSTFRRRVGLFLK